MPAERETRLPRFPTKKRYSPGERRTIIRRTTRALREIAKDDRVPAGDVANVVRNRAIRSGDAQAWKTLRQFRSAVTKETAQSARRADTDRTVRGSAFEVARRVRQEHAARSGRATGADARDAEVAGIPVGAALDEVDRRLLPDNLPALRTATRIGRTPIELLRATAEHPAAVAKTSVRTGVESIAGIPQGVKMLVEDPGGALEAIATDYEERYGSILDGDYRTFRERVKRDYGLTPYALDAAAFAGGAGLTAGAAARVGAVGRLATRLEQGGRASRAVGRATREVHEATTRERPRLRFSGGEGGTRAQPTSRNLVLAAGQRFLDSSRRRAFERDAEKAGWRPGPAGKLEPIEGRRQERLPGLRPGVGEVLPYRSPREVALLRPLTGRRERDLGAEKSRTRARLLRARGEELGAIDKLYRRLGGDERRALKYAVQLGAPAELVGFVRALERQRALIKRSRKKAGKERVAAVLADTNDELRLIDEILADPQRFATPRLREVADELLAIQRRTEARDPDLPPERAMLRRIAPQAEHLGIVRASDREAFLAQLDELDSRHGVEPGTHRSAGAKLADLQAKERVRAAALLEREAKAREREAARELERAERAASGAGSELQAMHDWAAGELPSVGMTIDEATRWALTERRHVHKLRDAARRAGDSAEVERTDEMLRSLDGIDGALKRDRAVRDAARADLERIRGTLETARRVSREVKKPSTRKLEDAESFERRVRQAAEEAGLEEPGYWASSPRPEAAHSLAAIGTGGRAAAKSKRYTGSLFRIGAEEHGPEVFARGVERNLKRRYSWALVARNMDVHAFEWSRGRDGEGLTAGDLRREFDERAIDPATVAIVDSRIARRRPPEREGTERGDVDGRDPIDEQLFAQMHEDLRASLRRVEDLDPAEVKGHALDRYLVVPREVFDELERASRPDGAASRMLEILLKQKPARVMLGAANVGWLAFQIASNAILTGLGGARNPLDVVNAHRWWRKLTPAQREAIEPYLGIGYHHAIDQPRLGSTTSSRFVAAWQAWQTTAVGRALHKANPLDAMFAVDRAQNDFWRKTLFYNRAKRDAYRRMGASWRSVAGAQKKMAAVLKLPAEKQLQAVLDDAEVFVAHAKGVNDWLGDYVTYTAQERRLIARNVVFFGYLRHSLRLALWTMPVEHPVMTAMLANVGRMGAQEAKRILGVEPDYRLPTSMVSRMFFGGRQAARDGELSSIPFGRLNPGLNAVTQLESEQQLVGLVSPIYQALVDQAFEESSFTGRDYRIKGRPTPAEPTRPRGYFGSALSLLNPAAYGIPGVSEGNPRNRILQRDLLSLAAPYRAIEKGGVPGLVDPLEGPQSDDSLLWDPRPMRYRDEDTRRSILRSVEREREERAGGRGLAGGLLPVFPQTDVSPVILEREREKETAQAGRGKKRRRRSQRSGWGSASRSGSSGWGAAAGTSDRGW